MVLVLDPVVDGPSNNYSQDLENITDIVIFLWNGNTTYYFLQWKKFKPVH